MRFALMLLLALWARAGIGQEVMPLDDVRAGMQGEAWTVFEGDQAERVPVDILGVLENTGPKRSLILVRLGGEQAQRTGVAAGMSGSPVYVDGRWVGALAFAFPFAKEPIGAVRPAEEMVGALEVEAPEAADSTALAQFAEAGNWRDAVLGAGLARVGPGPTESARDGMRPILTPVSLAGFTPGTAEVFRERLNALGLHPVQGAGGMASGDSSPLGSIAAGSMISVALVEGDLRLSAAGTVSHVSGDQIFAFGHRFLASGKMRMPFAPARVLVTVPNLENSFKIAAAGERAGVIEFDHDTGIRGTLGAEVDMIPVSLALSGASGQHSYSLEIVRDRLLTPFLLQLAVFSTLDATVRSAGGAGVDISGTVSLRDLPTLRIREFVTGAAAPLVEASLASVVPIAYLLQNAADVSNVESIELNLNTAGREARWRLGSLTADRTRVRPGDTVQFSVPLVSDGVPDRVIDAEFEVPKATPPGRLLAVIAGGAEANSLEWPVWYQLSNEGAPGAMISSLNRLRPADHAYLRLSQGEVAYALPGAALRNAPGSVSAVLASQFGRDPSRVIPESPIAERDLGPQGGLVSGIAQLELTVQP